MSNHPLSLSIPPVSEEVFRELEHAFSRIEPTPNSHTIEDIMYNAGSRAVIEWLKARYSRKSIVTGG